MALYGLEVLEAHVTGDDVDLPEYDRVGTDYFDSQSRERLKTWVSTSTAIENVFRLGGSMRCLISLKKKA
jgi:hypothetical protein